MKSELEMKKKK